MTKKKMFLHVGPHKTATTSLQVYLYANRALLAKNSVGYPIFHTPSVAHNALGLAFQQNDDPTRLMAIVEETAAANNAVIITDETMSSFNSPGIQGAHSLLEKMFSVEYFYVIRDPVERLGSSILHNIAQGVQDVSVPGGIVPVMTNARAFDRKQIDYFARRNTRMFAYSDVVDRGIEWLATEITGVQLPPADRRLNPTTNHGTTVLSLPEDRRRQIASFYDHPEITRILMEDGSPEELVRAAHRRMAEVLALI